MRQLAENSTAAVPVDEQPNPTVRRSSRVRKTPDRFINVEVESRVTRQTLDFHDSCNVEQEDASIKRSTLRKNIKIIDSPTPNELTCMFYAMYNSMQRKEERDAFADGNEEHPSRAFVSLFNDNTTDTLRQRIQNEGYTAEDMRQYLIYLKTRGKIKSYDWIHRTDWGLSTFFCGGQQNQRPVSWLLFGINVLSDERTVARNRIKIAGENEIGEQVLIDQCKESLAFMEDYLKVVPLKERWPHGGVLQRDAQGNTYYYDTAKNNVHRSPSVADVTEFLTGIYLAVEFKLYLPGDPNDRKKRKKEKRHKKGKKKDKKENS